MSQDGFTLIGTDESFLARQRNTFFALTEIEKKVNNRQEPMEIDDRHERRIAKTHKSHTKVFRGKDSIFKVPQDPVPRNFLKKIPDFKKNPHKWTKYSLEDVKDEDMSDEANTRAALSFLKDLESRNKTVEENIETNTEQKIVFRKPTNTYNISKEDTDSNPAFRNSKLVMPEYVVGKKIKKEKRTKGMRANEVNKNLKLDHLYQEDDQEE